MEKGYIHVYTGNGKGKTTAAFGVALRAAMTDKKVYIGQFVKDMKYSETRIEKYLKNIKIEQFGEGCFINRKANDIDKEKAKVALRRCAEILENGEYDLVILDEINIALYFELIDIDEVLNILKNRAEHVEVILTGRYAPKKLIESADLVTEMKEKKHYLAQGVISREGIDC